MSAPELGMVGRTEHDEVGGDHRAALVQELVERVLSVGAGFTPDHRSGLVGHRLAVDTDSLSVRLHVELLKIGRKAMEHPRVGEHGATRQIAEGAIPDLDQAEQSRSVLGDRGRCHVLVDRPESGEHLANAPSGPIAIMRDSPMAESIE